jgi:hypothetical protein
MSKETQIPQKTKIPQSVINEMASCLGITVSDLHRTLKLGNEIGPYEAGLNKKLDCNETLSSICTEIEINGSIRGERVG